MKDIVKEKLYKSMEQQVVLSDAKSIAFEIERNLFGKFRYLAKLLKFPQVIARREITLLNSGVKSSLFNVVCEAKLSKSKCEIVVKEACDEFQQRALPFTWWVGPNSTPPNLGAVLIKMGLRLRAQEIAMASLLTARELPPLDTGLEVLFVNSHLTLKAFIEVLQANDPTAAALYRTLPLDKLIQEHQLVLCVGFAGEVPVTIGTLFMQDEVAGIYDLLTHPNHRRNGFSTAMMCYLLEHARWRQAKLITLSTSPEEGLHIYERLGFRAYAALQVYESQPGID